MRFTPDNFLYMVKQLVTGTNLPVTTSKTGIPDGGIKVDRPYTVNAIAPLGANATVGALNNQPAVTTASTYTNIGTFGIQVPRDYDEASDNFKLRITAIQQTAVSSQTLLGTPYINGVAGTQVTGKAPFATANLNLSITAQVVELDFTGLGLKRDQIFSVVLAYGAAAGTSGTSIIGLQTHYDSTIVSYNETDATDTTDTVDGNALR